MKGLLQEDITKVNALGVTFLREQMSDRDKNDFRVETVLAMLDRYGITEGELENGNLSLLKILPSQLSDEKRLASKLMADNKKLLAVVNYFKSETCRRVFISEYFGFFDENPCGNCDVCNSSSI